LKRKAQGREFHKYLSVILDAKRKLFASEKQSEQADESTGRRKDLLDRLIAANMEEQDDKKISDDELAGHAVTFAFAGHETV